MTSYAKRRNQLMANMQAKGGGLAIIPTASEQNRNGDSGFPYRFDSNFYYLTGFAEPESLLVLSIGASGEGKSILFCREKNIEHEIWDGFRYGPQDACQSFGFDQAYPIGALNEEMPKLISGAQNLFYSFSNTAIKAKLEPQLQTWCDGLRANWRAGHWTPEQAQDVDAMLAEMRLFKDADEIALMHKAAQISARGHARAMRAARPGMFEYEIEAELLYEFRKSGAQYPAYPAIVAAGANSCILHYASNQAPIKDGDLILTDAGCELDGYAADISRTFPANGRFSPQQKDLYELVLASQLAALQHAQVGQAYMNGHDAAVRVLAQGMLDFKLLDANKVGNLDDVIEKKAYRKFYMHGTGHWLGLDVHDVGQYHLPPDATTGLRPWRTLQAGMVITIEPGIYIRPAEGVPEQFWNIGIRIEDDVLISAQGPQVLSADAPKTVAEIEHLMQHSSN